MKKQCCECKQDVYELTKDELLIWINNKLLTCENESFLKKHGKIFKDGFKKLLEEIIDEISIYIHTDEINIDCKYLLNYLEDEYMVIQCNMNVDHQYQYGVMAACKELMYFIEDGK